MHYSPHQLAYFAHKLTLRAATDSMDRMAGALLDAQVDLNPHQIDAALFATSNPVANPFDAASTMGARSDSIVMSHARKVLLTATPLQNSLLELYGLVSFIDDRVFGDLDSFRQQFGQLRDAGSFEALKHRISPICKRTLRRQVGAYVKYTKRIPLLRAFKPGDDETRLYDLVSEYLQRLASSTFAIAGALNTLIRRLKQTLDEKAPGGLVDELDEDYESLGETADELGTDDADEEVQERLKVAQTDAKASLDRLERLLMRFTQAMPDGHAASAAPRARARPRSPRSSSIRSCSEPWRPRAKSKASCGKRWIYIQYWPHSGGCNEY